MAKILQAFLHQAQSHGHGSRSTALTSLHWLIGILISATISAAALVPHEPWLWRSCAMVCVAIIVVFVIAYFYLLLNAPDALRSERYSISKMMLEKGMIGDSTSGLRDANDLLHSSKPNSALTSEGSE